VLGTVMNKYEAPRGRSSKASEDGYYPLVPSDYYY
jgi:hypothetical protein